MCTVNSGTRFLSCLNAKQKCKVFEHFLFGGLVTSGKQQRATNSLVKLTSLRFSNKPNENRLFHSEYPQIIKYE
jgi:hypothetical protein